jgi:hypothetical protein
MTGNSLMYDLACRTQLATLKMETDALSDWDVPDKSKAGWFGGKAYLGLMVFTCDYLTESGAKLSASTNWPKVKDGFDAAVAGALPPT